MLKTPLGFVSRCLCAGLTKRGLNSAPAAANDFFAALLAVMQNSGFQRFEFFDESGEVNTFASPTDA
ncbi:hypothetical protein P0F40_003268 [Vibrio metschnikovii]|uniref:Uncharacterized protein n=3 Tax=Unclassified Bacteria TaxID=49928 RepID=A0AAU6TLQ5_UNCXX|nr:hypothetical protein [Vibrio metschnikovii]EKO3592674.1 hypothetical protein [Vibrio metschnikovii]EKO3600852.1 hypothetical protein [Vibrio metschnikovii]EKO3642112.1 hypothetical protein [Vibrio metschnikovii]EKO3665361.1 hypothetical protein [Vibrio metschnikovii]